MDLNLHGHLCVPRRIGVGKVVTISSTTAHQCCRNFPGGVSGIEFWLDQLSVIWLCVVSFKHFLCQKRLPTGYLVMNQSLSRLFLMLCSQSGCTDIHWGLATLQFTTTLKFIKSEFHKGRGRSSWSFFWKALLDFFPFSLPSIYLLSSPYLCLLMKKTDQWRQIYRPGMHNPVCIIG